MIILLITHSFISRWLPRAALRSIEGDPNDCVLVVGVSRPKMALAVLIVLLLSIFLTFHLIYDTALNTLKEKPDPHHHRSAPVLLLSKRLYPDATRRLPQVSYLIIQSIFYFKRSEIPEVPRGIKVPNQSLVRMLLPVTSLRLK